MHITKGPRDAPLQAMLPFREARMHKGGRHSIAARPRATSTLRSQESAVLLQSFRQLDLELPLFDRERTVFDASFEVSGPQQTRAAAPQVQLEDTPSHFEDLTDEHVALFHAKLLYRQLEQLFYARNVDADSRREVLDWIYQPTELEHERADGSVTTIAAVFVPFSFEACCSFEQIDAYQLRQAITRRIDSLRGSRTLLARPTETELQ